jgi:serine protease Do
MTPYRSFALLVTAAVFALSVPLGIAPASALDLPAHQSFADIAGRVRNSVVTVAAAVIDRRAVAEGRSKTKSGDDSRAGTEEDPPSFDDFSPSRPKRRPGEPQRQFTSIGSGFIIDSSGLIVTNNHVIEGGNTIYVILSDGTELKVDRILGRDPKTDLTLLKVTPKPSKPLTAVSFGDSARMRVGDWVIAIGNPFGLDGTVTAGIVSGIGRDINAGPYDDFLQTDAAINRGNSGGPLFNASGEVIGINTAIFSPSGGSIGLGFAIPSNTARRILDQLQRYGETRWGWIGVRVQTPSDDLAAGLKLPSAQGAIIARVEKGGPADAAGLAEGDLILSFAGSKLKHARQLPRLVARTVVGDEVDVVVLRSGERKSLRLKVGRLEDPAAPGLPAGVQGKPKRQRFGKNEP